MTTRRAAFAAIASLLTAAPWAAARAQARASRIGLLASSPPPAHFVEAFRAGLREHGLVEGRNLALVVRATGGTPEGLDALAGELVRMPVDLILAWATPATLAAKRATASVPIVFVSVADPVGAGIVTTLARPGGNVTGVTNLARDLNVKLVELVAQIAPRARVVAVLRNPTNAATVAQADEMIAAARALRHDVAVFTASDAAELERTFAAIAGAGAGALVVIPDPMFMSERRRIANLALRSGLPSAYARREAVEAGGLVAYGASLVEQTRLAADYAARILKGARPAEMPVEQPTRLELVVNLGTAKALGVTVPQAVLLRADEVIP